MENKKKKKEKTTNKKTTKSSTTKKKTTTKKSTTVKKNTTTKKTTQKKTEIKEDKQSYKGPILDKKEKKSFKQTVKELPKKTGTLLINFIKNIPNYLKNILKCIKIVCIKIGKFFIFIFGLVINFFKWIFNKLKELDKKDNERIEKKKAKRRKKQDELYNTTKFDLRLLQDDYDRDELELVSYKDHKNKIGVFFENRGRVLKFDMKKFNKRFKYGTLRDKVLIIIMLLLIFIFALAIFLITYVIITAPNIDNDKDVNIPEYATIK